MRTPFVAGNWKMNKTADAAVTFVREITPQLDAIAGIDIAVCPPFIALPAVAAAVAGTKVGVGAQNMYHEVSGAYTGEVSPAFLAKLDVRYVIAGHSERRELFGETDEWVAQKVRAILAMNMAPILCVGETLEEREAGRTEDKVLGQLRLDLAGLAPEQVAGSVIAYEPIWAIGTGRTATAADAQAVIGAIRAEVGAG